MFEILYLILTVSVLLCLPYVKKRADYEEEHELGGGWEYHSLEKYWVRFVVKQCK